MAGSSGTRSRSEPAVAQGSGSSSGGGVRAGSAKGAGPGSGSGPATRTVAAPADDGNLDELSLPEHLEVRRVLGRGGMAVVLEAHDHRLDRDVAIKVLPPGRWSDGVALERFSREARVTAGLKHPGIVEVYELGDRGEYIVMEIVRGESLRDRLTRDGKLPAAEVRRIGRALCDALACAHAAGVVHRDIKPSNILLDEDGAVRLTDFGIAALDGSDVTQTGAVLGTPRYMAPEQLRGGAVDARADVFGVGATLYECATGDAPDPATLDEVGRRTRRASRSPALGRALARATTANPDRRWGSVDELAAALGRGDGSMRRRFLGFAAVAMVVGLVAGAGSALVAGGSPPTRAAAVAPPHGTEIALLPFENHITDDAMSMAATGVPELIGNRLALNLPHKIIALDKVLATVGDRRDARELRRAAAALGATLIVTGQLAGDSHGVTISVVMTTASGTIVASVERKCASANLGPAAASLAAELLHAIAPGSTVADFSAQAEHEVDLGVEALRADRFGDSLAHFDNALGFVPAHADAIFYRAIAMWWTSPDRGIEAIDQALAAGLSPRHADILRGFRLLMDNQFPAAGEAFHELARRYPDDEMAIYGLFEAEFHGGHPELGVAAFHQLRQISPHFHEGVMHCLGFLTNHPDRKDLAWLMGDLDDDPRNRRWKLDFTLARRDLETAGRLLAQLDMGLALDSEAGMYQPLQVWYDLMREDVAAATTVALQPSNSDRLLASASIALLRGDRADEARWLAAADGAARGHSLFEWSALAILVAGTDERALQQDLLRRFGDLHGWEQRSMTVRVARLQLAGALGDDAVIAEELHSPFPEVAATAAGFAAERRGEVALAGKQLDLAIAQLGDGQEGALLHAAAARIARARKAWPEVLAHCGEVEAPRHLSWSWGALVGPCLLWTGEAARALGDRPRAEAALSKLLRLRGAASQDDPLVHAAVVELGQLGHDKKPR